MEKLSIDLYLDNPGNRRLSGYKFVRECVIGNYIADFVCRDKKLIVEIDGGQHMEAAEYDQRRTDYLTANGYRVVRFWNNNVFNNVPGSRIQGV
jgi:very-short-patch-repair endonuclease